MNKVLIIPDIHGLDFWKEPCSNWNGPIIFLGDYVDPYYPTTHLEAFNNLKDLVEFSKNTKCTCKFILGNHDISYLIDKDKCRFDYKHSKEIKELLEELNLVICTYIKTPNKTYLFSHAGITNGWLYEDDYKRDSFVIPNGYKDMIGALRQVPYSRGGDSSYGSCIWNSIEDFDSEEHNKGILSNTYQIFGHTWGGRTEPIIKEDYAMLDCHKPFILNIDSGEICLNM